MPECKSYVCNIQWLHMTFRQIGTSRRNVASGIWFAMHRSIDHGPWINSLVYLLLCFSSGGGRGGYNKGKCTRLFVLVWCYILAFTLLYDPKCSVTFDIELYMKGLLCNILKGSAIRVVSLSFPFSFPSLSLSFEFAVANQWQNAPWWQFTRRFSIQRYKGPWWK